jgi:hypothetical protein
MSCGSSGWEASENDTLYIFILKDRCLGESRMCMHRKGVERKKEKK